MTSTRRTGLAALAATTAVVTGLALAAPAALAHGGDSGPGGGGHHGDHHGDDHSAPATHLPLPNGFRPEGITTGSRHTAYLGSLTDGDIYRLDLRRGTGMVISEGPGTSSVGLKLDHDQLFVSGGSAGDARIVDARSGTVLASYTLVPAGTPSFINDVIVTDKAAWFTDSLDNALYRLPLRDDHRSHHGHHRRHGATATTATTGSTATTARCPARPTSPRST